MSTIENVAARKIADEALTLVLDLIREASLSPQATAHALKCLYESLCGLRNDDPASKPKETPQPAQRSLAATSEVQDVLFPADCRFAGEAIDLNEPEHVDYLEWLAEQPWIRVAAKWELVAEFMEDQGFL